MLTEAAKNILMSMLKEWSKYVTERERLTLVANEVALSTKMIVQECLAFLKSHNVDVKCETPEDMEIMGIPVLIKPQIEENFPNVKASVLLKCAGAARAIVINQNLSISAGGSLITYDQFRKGVPTSFLTNAAEFVSDSFLYIARTGGKEQ